jgi:hypothetical protein
MPQRSQKSGKEEKNKTDEKGKREKKDKKKLLLPEFQGAFLLAMIKNTYYTATISEIKVKRNGKNSFVYGI